MVFGLAVSNLPLLLILVGAGLIIAEALAPGAHFFVAGVALFFAGVVGVGVSAIFGGGIVVLLAMTVTVLVSAAATLYGYQQLDIYGGNSEGQTSDSASLRGETGRVTETVTPTDGKVKLDGGGFNPHYQARSIDGEIEEGSEVMVVDPGGGNVVTVESVSNLRDDIDRELDREAASQTEQASE
jgi:membrane protein implicated in regulation of membrane protease activity